MLGQSVAQSLSERTDVNHDKSALISCQMIALNFHVKNFMVAYENHILKKADSSTSPRKVEICTSSKFNFIHFGHHTN